MAARYAVHSGYCAEDVYEFADGPDPLGDAIAKAHAIIASPRRTGDWVRPFITNLQCKGSLDILLPWGAKMIEDRAEGEAFLDTLYSDPTRIADAHVTPPNQTRARKGMTAEVEA